jgi:hypothetical protein
VADCQTCHRPIPPNPGRGAPRKYHEGCKPKRRTAELGVAPSEGASVVQMRPAADVDPLSLEAATLADLRPVDRDRTTAGVATLKLARLIDAGGYNAQGAAALVKAHREALEVALEGTSPTADVIDAIFGSG